MQEVRLGIDFETSGYCTGYNSLPIQIGVAIMNKGVIDTSSSWQHNLALPQGHPISHHAYNVHRLTHRDLENTQPFVEQYPKLKAWRPFAHRWVGHQIGTERTTLNTHFPLDHFGPWTDTCQLAKKLKIKTPNYKLTTLLDVAGLRRATWELSHHHEPHEALFDAVGSLLLLQWLENQTPQRTMPPKQPEFL